MEKKFIKRKIKVNSIPLALHCKLTKDKWNEGKFYRDDIIIEFDNSAIIIDELFKKYHEWLLKNSKESLKELGFSPYDDVKHMSLNVEIELEEDVKWLNDNLKGYYLYDDYCPNGYPFDDDWELWLSFSHKGVEIHELKNKKLKEA